MIVRLCRVGIARLAASGDELLDALREREHTPVVRDCLDRCGACEKGTLVATADGMPIGVADGAALLAAIDALAAD